MADSNCQDQSCCGSSSTNNIKNADNLDLPAEADIDLDAMHPEIEVPTQRWPLTEQELADGFKCVTEDGGITNRLHKHNHLS